MSHLIKVYAVCKFSYFRLELQVLKENVLFKEEILSLRVELACVGRQK